MLGIIGGTGLYKMDNFELLESREVKTPYGQPSAPIALGKVNNQPVAFLPRHGKGHTLLASEINFRANIWALKSVGVRRIIGVSAIGSLKAELEPGHLVLPDQYLDFTKGLRAQSFFGGGLVAHVSTAEPSCADLQDWISETAEQRDLKTHRHQTYACIEGPRLGTRAESRFLQLSGATVVGMTNIPEAFLAREAQLCYATIGIVTDYDCWLDDPAQHVSTEKAMELYGKNISRVQDLFKVLLERGERTSNCVCRQSLKGAVLTARERLSAELRERLEFLLI